MIGSPLRAARTVAAAGLVWALAAGCGGSSKVETFKVGLEPEDTVQTVWNRALTSAVERCVKNDKLVLVKWTFTKKDLDNPIIQQYLLPQGPGRNILPTSISCDTIPRDTDPSTLTSQQVDVPVTEEETPSTDPDEDNRSSQEQDEGGKAGPSTTAASTATTAAGATSSTAGAPSTSTAAKS